MATIQPPYASFNIGSKGFAVSVSGSLGLNSWLSAVEVVNTLFT
jgi:hypothetical protein